MSIFYAVNRYNHTAQLLPFEHWEQVQGAFHCGIKLADESMATGIGRCHSLKQFKARAEFGEWHVLTQPEVTTVTNWNMPINTAWE